MTSPYQFKGVKNFLTERLKSFAGYLCAPTVSDAMHFFLPPFRVTSERIVRVNDCLWELWSPNSERAVYYPGLRDPSLNPENITDPRLKRCDGHLGRFDPTVSPQHFDVSRPWLGFIRRDGNESHPEYTLILDVWQPVARPNKGYIKPSYVSLLAKRAESVIKCMDGWKVLEKINPNLWKNRPLYPTVIEVNTLQVSLSLDEAVDSLSKIQRGIKCMSAWCRMAHALVTDEKSSKLPIQSVPAADEFLMGVWLNGCDEVNGLWLLRWKIPCFIIHTIDSAKEMDRVYRCNPQYPNFAEGTPAARLAAGIYAIDLAVINDRGRLCDTESDFAIRPLRMTTPQMHTDRSRSSPVNQGYRNGKYMNPRSLTLDKPATLGIEEVDGKLIPPPVASLSTGTTWTTWREDTTDNGDPCMIMVGKKSGRNLSGKLYYDRELHRRLHFDSHPFIPPHYDADISLYGLPAPEMLYQEMGNNDLRYNRRPSRWIYKRDLPARGTEGMTYQNPNVMMASSSEQKRVIPDSSDSEDGEDHFVGRNANYSGSQSAFTPYQSPPHRSKSPSPRRSENYPPRPDNHPNRMRFKSPLRKFSVEAAPWEPRGRDERTYRRESRSREPRRRVSPQHYTRRSTDRRSPSSRHRNYDYSSDLKFSRPSSPVGRRSPARYRSPMSRRSKSPLRGRRMAWSPQRRTPPRRPMMPPRPATPLCLESRLRSRSPMHTMSSSRPASRTRSGSSLRSESPPRQPSPAIAPQSRAQTPLADEDDVENENDMDTSPDDLMVVAQRQLPDRETLDALFPALTAPPFPVLTSLTARLQTRFLCIWSLHVFFTWDDIIKWIRLISIRARIQISRVVRTNEDGFQVLWLRMGTVKDAASFRGLVDGVHTTDTKNISCDFISTDVYSTICGKSMDAWSPVAGLELEQSLYSPFSLNSRLLPKVGLADRLSSDPTPVQNEASGSIASLASRISPALVNSSSSLPLQPRPRIRRGKRRGTRGMRTAEGHSNQDLADGGAL